MGKQNYTPLLGVRKGDRKIKEIRGYYSNSTFLKSAFSLALISPYLLYPLIPLLTQIFLFHRSNFFVS
ncbi:MAG: hypothetical protein AB1422_05395 [bacterium]